MTKCDICGENTNRSFKSLNSNERKKLEKARKIHEEREAKEKQDENP